MSAKTACAKLESELKQEKGNGQDLRKMLADERNVMSTMDVEHQQQLVELEQRHEEKVLIAVTLGPVDASFPMLSYSQNLLSPFLRLVQVLYLLDQLQSKPVSAASQKEEDGAQEKELLQRLQLQVCSHQRTL